MVWVVEKKVVYYFLDLGFESVKVPIRVRFEYQIKEGTLVRDSMSRSILYNQRLLQKRYPNLDSAELERAIEEKVDSDVYEYLKACGFVRGEEQ
ncbi:MAG: hypothetical protein ACLFVT_05550 [Syntrophobacteria bacterium]